MGRRINRNSGGTADVTVTLVHGTYARNAAWTSSEGALHATLSGAGYRVVPFSWSGKNSHRARDRATSELVTHLESQMAATPKARQWIVAHSHGGNVALRAMEAVDKSVSTITLATPFIHSRGRDVPIHQALMTALFGILLISLACTSALTEPKAWIDWTIISFAALLCLMLALCAVGLAMHRKKLGRGFRSKLVTSIHSPSTVVSRTTVIRSAGDEASTFLVAGQFIGWLTGASSRLFGSFKLWTFILLTTQASILAAAALHTRRLAFMQYFFAVPGLALVALITLLLSSSLVFGIDGPFVSLFGFSSVEASPPGKAVLMQLEPFAPQGRRLAHSRLYDDERVIREVLQVIQQGMAKRTLTKQ
ncbi:esterase/lipase family protein [Streptomyces lydicus]|uniref:esterase/lipase family protein n=1 Tax=Streptomyces lydicus TaxID=47763 RepID=UPI0013DD9F97|nr:alpha/beta hydrolase [Streptomyces lydicus]